MTIDLHYEAPKPKVKKFFVYMARTKTGSFYTGIAVDPKKRCREHNECRRGAKSLRGQRPIELIWFLDEPLTQANALKFEWQLKKLSHGEKVKFLKGDLSIEIPGS